MNKAKINQIHKEFSNEIRKFCKSNDVTHMDLLIVIISTQHILLSFLKVAEVTAHEIADVIFESIPEGRQKDAYQESIIEGLDAAEYLAKMFGDVYKKFPPEDGNRTL